MRLPLQKARISDNRLRVHLLRSALVSIQISQSADSDHHGIAAERSSSYSFSTQHFIQSSRSTRSWLLVVVQLVFYRDLLKVEINLKLALANSTSCSPHPHVLRNACLPLFMRTIHVESFLVPLPLAHKD